MQQIPGHLVKYQEGQRLVKVFKEVYDTQISNQILDGQLNGGDWNVNVEVIEGKNLDKEHLPYEILNGIASAIDQGKEEGEASIDSPYYGGMARVKWIFSRAMHDLGNPNEDFRNDPGSEGVQESTVNVMFTSSEYLEEADDLEIVNDGVRDHLVAILKGLDDPQYQLCEADNVPMETYQKARNLIDEGENYEAYQLLKPYITFETSITEFDNDLEEAERTKGDRYFAGADPYSKLNPKSPGYPFLRHPLSHDVNTYMNSVDQGLRYEILYDGGGTVEGWYMGRVGNGYGEPEPGDHIVVLAPEGYKASGTVIRKVGNQMEESLRENVVGDNIIGIVINGHALSPQSVERVKEDLGFSSIEDLGNEIYEVIENDTERILEQEDFVVTEEAVDSIEVKTDTGDYEFVYERGKFVNTRDSETYGSHMGESKDTFTVSKKDGNIIWSGLSLSRAKEIFEREIDRANGSYVVELKQGNMIIDSSEPDTSNPDDDDEPGRDYVKVEDFETIRKYFADEYNDCFEVYSPGYNEIFLFPDSEFEEEEVEQLAPRIAGTSDLTIEHESGTLLHRILTDHGPEAFQGATITYISKGEIKDFS